nr:DUF982 domain-containing protein [uncultured Gellertiella sp.]
MEHTFINAYDALDFLENEWPLRTGTSYAHAVAVLGDVLAGRRASRAARSALISACHEAGLTPVIVELSGNGSRPNAA